MNRLAYETIMNNLRNFGTKYCACIPRTLFSVDVEYQRLESRSEAKIATLHRNWNHTKMEPLLVVPHPETATFSIVDGYGRLKASEGICDELECVVITDAPTDIEARRKFEAEIFVTQNDCKERISLYQKHNAKLVLEDVPAILLERKLKEYNLKLTKGRGRSSARCISDYDSVYHTCKVCGEAGIDFVFSTLKLAGYDLATSGYTRVIVRNLTKIYTAYGNNVSPYIASIMRESEPYIFTAKALAKYPERPTTAISLYIQDFLMSAGLERKLDEKGRLIA